MSEMFLLCRVLGHVVAFPAAQVLSVIEIDEVVPIPAAPPWIEGMTALRSQPLTVIDCGRAIEANAVTRDDRADVRAAVVQVDGHRYALLVDDAYDVVASEVALQPVPGGLGDRWARAAHGMIETGSGAAVVLDISALVSGGICTNA